MILRKLVVENFRQIHGRSEIRFAPPGDRNVTVILGQNGAGKTTLLNSLLWCLYGRLDMENESEIVCHKAVQDTAIGERVSTEVTLVTSDGTKSYTLTRKTTFQKLDGGKLEEVQPPELRVDVTDQSGVTEKELDPKQFVQQMLPERLSGFFFFRGEDMEDLALQSSSSELAAGVEEFLNFTLLDRAVKHLDRVGKDFELDLAKVAVGDTKLLTDQISDAETDLTAAKGKLDTERQNVTELQKKKESIERQLAEFNTTRPLLERRGQLEERKKLLTTQEGEQRRALAATLSRDGFLWQSEAVFTQPLKLAEEAVKRGEIPAKIKPKFVDDLLKMGECICGKHLDSDMRAHLEKWRGADGLAVFEESINQLRNSVDALAKRRPRFLADYTRDRTAWSETKEALRKVQGEISATDSELQGKDFGLEEIRALQSKHKEVTDDIIERNAEVSRSADKVKQLEDKLEELRATRKRHAKDIVQAQIIQRRYDAVAAVSASLTKMREGWLTIVQEYLNRQLKANWEKVAQLERLVEFTPQFRLSIKERGPEGTWTTSAPSSANLRALALCFVSALIKLANEIGIESRQKADSPRKHQMFQGGEYPLVMDAPFATMDKYFKQTVPPGLRAVVPQMVIISNYDQWSGDVESMLRSSVGESYVLELHIPGKGDEGISVPFAGRTVDYVVPEPGAATDWTIIRGTSS